MYDSHLRWYSATQKIAKNHHSGGRYGIAAIVVKNSRILSVGYNYYISRRYGNHPLYDGVGLHAELSAVLNVDCKNATLYVAGYTEFGTEICTKPCHRCAFIIAHSQLKSVVFLNKDHVLIHVKRGYFNDYRAV